MAHTPTCLADYPYVVVRFSCWYCKRRGGARLSSLAEKHGAGCRLEALLDRVAFTCPYPRQPSRGRSKFRPYEPRCGIYLPDIENTDPPPPDEPPPPVDRRLRLVVNRKPDKAA